LIANRLDYKEAYATSAVKADTHYYCRFQDGSWRIGKSMMTSETWFEFAWTGKPGEMVPDIAADGYVTQQEKA
jgi:hypothetical protein